MIILFAFLYYHLLTIFASKFSKNTKETQGKLLVNEIIGCIVMFIAIIFAQLPTSLFKINKENKVLQLSLEESCVYELLKMGEMHYNELLTASGLEPRKLNTLLMRLEINGVIKKLAGNVYSIF